MHILSRRSLLLLAILSLQSYAPQAFAASVTYGLTTDPGQAGGAYGHGTKLDGHDSVLIEAPVEKKLPGNNPFASSYAPVCYSLDNQNSQGYFVPWNTPHEWSSFLNSISADFQLYQLGVDPAFTPVPTDTRWLQHVGINLCCPEEQVGTICSGIHGAITSTAELGYRYKGTFSGDVPNWGAQYDVYGPIFAAAVGGDPSINYQVTFVCENGSWIKTHVQGSCIPLDGACAVGSSGLTTLPVDYTTLCATGSTFGGFTNPGGASSPGPWTWTCLGTPTRPSATCSTGPMDGVCGSALGVVTPSAPITSLCANGTTPSGVSGPDVNVFTNPGTSYVPNLFHWTCSGTGGSLVTASCSAPMGQGACSYGMWGSPVGQFLPVAPNPSADFMCKFGTPSPITYGPSPWNSSFMAWNWTCNGSLGTDQCTTFDSTAPLPGGCGSVPSTIYTSSSIPPSGSLCDSHSALASGPTFVGGVPPHWVWTCQGLNGGSTASCNVLYDPNPGTCGPAQGLATMTAPSIPAQLCSGGTSSVPWSNGSYWLWNCTGTSGDTVGCNAPVQYLGACGPADGVGSSTSPSSGLCASGSNPSFVANASGTWVWQCAGAWGGTIVNCSAPVTVAPPSATCGTASGVPSVTVPGAGLCGLGSFATSITSSGGSWTWTCVNGPSNVPCSAPIAVSGPGICGATNGTSIPDEPNANLCSSGVAGTVGGAGPWNWTCYGQGTDTGNNMNCSANICGACIGSVTNSISTPIVSGTVGGCSVHGHATWVETDVISPSNSTMQLQWNDPFYGSFSKLVNPVSPGTTYCPPCFQTMQSVSNAQVTVQAVTGSCLADPALNSGNPVVYIPTGMTITPH